jgi:ferric-dicitrate binding protein FerR (iron transport regulator)
MQAERQWQIHQEEYAQVGERLDRLMAMLEHLTKEPEAHQHEQPHPVQRRKGGEHVR